MFIKNGFRVVFAGDSITDSGRFLAGAGAGPNYPLGNGYVKFFAEMVAARYPQIRVEVYNAGVSGNTVKDLRDRWEDDVLSLSPDWVSVLIGINDLNRSLAGEPGLDPGSYYSNYSEILKMTAGKVSGITTMTPFYVSGAKGGNRAMVITALPKYVEKVKSLSSEYSTELIDLSSAFAYSAKVRGPLTYSLEAVHPSETGHMLIALKLLESVKAP